MAQMLVQMALNELQVLENRLSTRLSDFTVVGSHKVVNNNVYETRESVEKFIVNANAKIQSANDIIKRYNVLKNAIMLSNAKTIVTVAGKEYTVMAAIERKRSISYERSLLNKLKMSVMTAEDRVGTENQIVEREIEKRSVQMCGGDISNRKADFITEFEKNYRANNEWETVNIDSVKVLIEEMEEAITLFELEIDTALTVSNATTLIEV